MSPIDNPKGTALLKNALAAAAIGLTLSAGAAPAAAAPAAPTMVVLVHGAFADGSAWNKVVPRLQAQGLKVVSVQNPLTSLADDVAATRRVLDAQTGPVVLVGHSWGGVVITEAGQHERVKSLVYVAAFAKAIGATVVSLPTSHVPQVSRPKEVADAIIAAAGR
jgi:pimeloyl-ACP methyl ester carboxylesterase